MDMGSLLHQFLQQLINGISLGSIYALIALGYTMIYGILKLINFAHGDIYMLGAYFGFVATTMLGFSFVPAIIFAMVGAAIAGIRHDVDCHSAAAHFPGCICCRCLSFRSAGS